MQWNAKQSLKSFEQRLAPLPRSRIKEFRHRFPRFCSAYEERFGRSRLTRIMLPLLEEGLEKYPPKNLQKGHVGESIAAATISLFMDDDEMLFRNFKYYYKKEEEDHKKGEGELDLIIFSGPFIVGIGEVKTGVNGRHRKNLSKARRYLPGSSLMAGEKDVKILSKICLSLAKIETLEDSESVKLEGEMEIYLFQKIRFFSVGPWDAHPSINPTFKMPVHSLGIELLSKDMRGESKKKQKKRHSKNR